MAEKEINLRRLVIKAFHMTDVEWGDENNITTDGHMTVSKGMLEQLTAEDDCIEKIDIQIIKPGDHDRRTRLWILSRFLQRFLESWEKVLHIR